MRFEKAEIAHLSETEHFNLKIKIERAAKPQIARFYGVQLMFKKRTGSNGFL
jgi:hypothetical protein